VAKKIRAGVIGCGGMGRAHVQALAGHEAFELVAGCDINREALDNLPDDAARYREAEAMLAEHKLDLVSIIVPNCLYEPMVKLAAAHGACVFTEKPFGHNLASCRAMIATLEAAGLRGWVGAQRKYAAHFRKAGELVEGMALDFVNVVFTYYWPRAFADPGWRGDRARSGGVAVIDSGWHVLDCLDWFLGGPDAVSAQLAFLAAHPDIDDKAAIHLHYPSGLVGNVFISYTLPKADMDITFSAGPRSLYLNYERLSVFDAREEVAHLDAVKDEPLFPAMYDELAKAYAGDTSAYLTDMHRAERIMRVVDAAYESARDGKPVQLS